MSRTRNLNKAVWQDGRSRSCPAFRDPWGEERYGARTFLRLCWEGEKTCVAPTVLRTGVRRFPALRAGLKCDAPPALRKR